MSEGTTRLAEPTTSCAAAAAAAATAAAAAAAATSCDCSPSMIGFTFGLPSTPAGVFRDKAVPDCCGGVNPLERGGPPSLRGRPLGLRSLSSIFG